MDLLYILGYYSIACVYFSFRWGPFVHSLGIVQWNFTRRDHLGNPGRVSGSGPVIRGIPMLLVQLLEPKSVLFILQAFTPGWETIMQGNKTERLLSMSGLYVFK